MTPGCASRCRWPPAASEVYADLRYRAVMTRSRPPTAARKKWEADRFANENAEPEHQLVFGGKVPFDALTAAPRRRLAERDDAIRRPRPPVVDAPARRRDRRAAMTMRLTGRAVRPARPPCPRARRCSRPARAPARPSPSPALVTRYVAEGVARLDELLVVTFGRAATQELRDRVRERLVTARDGLVDPVGRPGFVRLAVGAPRHRNRGRDHGPARFASPRRWRPSTRPRSPPPTNSACRC